jgi:tetratricopeptide (TPR) repeat protein
MPLSRVTPLLLVLGMCPVQAGRAQDLAGPASVESRLALGDAAVRAGKFGQAIAAFQSLLPELQRPDAPADLPPRLGAALNNLAYQMAEGGGDLDRALELAQRARQLLPDRPDVASTVGWIHLKKNQAARAIEIFRELVARYPADVAYRYRLGMALTQIGDTFAASAELRAALALNPPDELAARILRLLRVM